MQKFKFQNKEFKIQVLSIKTTCIIQCMVCHKAIDNINKDLLFVKCQNCSMMQKIKTLQEQHKSEPFVKMEEEKRRFFSYRLCLKNAPINQGPCIYWRHWTFVHVKWLVFSRSQPKQMTNPANCCLWLTFIIKIIWNFLCPILEVLLLRLVIFYWQHSASNLLNDIHYFFWKQKQIM